MLKQRAIEWDVRRCGYWNGKANTYAPVELNYSVDVAKFNSESRVLLAKLNQMVVSAK